LVTGYRVTRFYNLVFCTFILFFHCSAQVDTEFWFAPPEITSGHGDLPLILRVSAQAQTATVRVLQPARGNIELANFTIPANTTQVIDLSAHRPDVETSLPNTVMNTGLHIISSAPITAYYEEASFLNAEIFVLKGKNAIGHQFIIAAQNFFDNSSDYFPTPYFSFDIVATKNNTIVKVRPTKPIEGFEGDSVITIRLNAGETYSFKKKGFVGIDNPVGTLVESSQPIAITVKDDSLINGTCRDLVGDQLIPVEVAGKEYIVVKGFLNNFEFFFITGTEDNTSLYMEGIDIPVATVNKGESRRFQVRTPAIHIRSDKRIYVNHVTGFGCEMGMAVLPPINCTGSRQIGFTRSSSEFFGMNVLVKKDGIYFFTLNGSTALIPPQVFQPVIGTNDEWYTAQLSFSTTEVPVNQSSLIQNSKYSFQAGIINGNATTSARFGYFSSFSTLFIGDDFDFCDGATAIIDAGPGKESYLWNTGAATQSIEVDETGDYWVTVVREDCVLSDTIHVSERIPKIDLGPDVSVCEGDTARVDGKENFSWQWSDGTSQQFLETKNLGKYWVSVFDEIGCRASDTIMISRLIHIFEEDVMLKLAAVSVDTANEQSIKVEWIVTDKERREENTINIYKRISGSLSWDTLTRVPASNLNFIDTENDTDSNIFEYYLGLANQCGEEQRVTNIHNSIQLTGEGDENANVIRLNWNYYQQWDDGVKNYELWRKKEDESSYSFLTELNTDAKSFLASITTDAFHHDYVIRAIESSGTSESWSNNIQFDFEHPVYVPNVFTPNDDGYNQYFEIKNIQLYKKSQLLILNRWGATVLQAEGYSNDWDGGDFSSGVYYFILRLNRNDLKPIKGSLSILK
jgi:gliding motility-associated-like protein